MAVFRERSHTAMKYRMQRVRERAYNLFCGMEAVGRQIPPDDPRFANLKTILDRFYDQLVTLYKIEDEIDDEISRLAAEVGR
jgi:hypothetical protein